MRTWPKQILTAVQRFFDFLIEVTPLWCHLVFFVIVVCASGLAYFVLTPYGHGMGHDFQKLENPTIWEGLYFSIVTVSSLGYGDIHPMGFSRTLACIEVLFGLTFMGVMVAKLTSRRLSYHVQRLFSSDAQRRLDELAVQLEPLETELRDRMKKLGAAFQTTPGGLQATLQAKTAARRSFQESLRKLHAPSETLAGYLAHELGQTGFFEIAPVIAVRRVVFAVEKNLFGLGQLVISLSAEARTNVLDPETRQRITDTLSHSVNICNLIDHHGRDREAKQCALRIRDICMKVSQGYFSTPAPLPAAEQPDQVVPVADEPAEIATPEAITNNDTDHPNPR